MNNIKLIIKNIKYIFAPPLYESMFPPAKAVKCVLNRNWS